ncbi:TIGR02206 family membrane protein [Aerococcaceae bacterium 50-4]
MESWDKRVSRKAKIADLKEKIYLNCVNIDAPFINAFSLAHILYLAAFFMILIAMFVFRDFINTNQVVIGRVLFTVSVLQQILLYSWYYFETKFDLKQALPLHICRLSTIMGLVYLVTGNQMVMQVLFYFGLYAYFSFFMPSRINKIYHVSGLSYFLNHVITILIPFFAYFTTGWTPSSRGLIVSLGAFAVYWFVALLVNRSTGGNYFYMKYRPLPILDKLNFPTYAVGNFVLTLIVFLIGYSVFNLFA